MSDRRAALPSVGTPWSELEQAMRDYASADVDWRGGKASVYVFHSGDDVMQVAHDAYGMFIAENGLGPAAFPSLKRMEREVIEMALSLQQAPDTGAGAMTSGGTESILLAVKACRDRTDPPRRVTGVPEILAPYSVHPAFDKGAHLMGLRVVRVPCGPDLRADADAMDRAVTDNTVMIVGSAPCFPYGVIDPIEDLATIARRAGLWLHVDACVGGYINPFMSRVSEAPLPVHDFSIPEVLSMSLDLHKYGYAAKGASTVLYRDKALRGGQVFDFDDWPCGRMYTPTFAGTRPGGAIAAAWAVMRYLGEEGYTARARWILETRERLCAGVERLGLKVLGAPCSSIVAFGWADGDILAVGEGLYESGWFSSRVQAPDGIQVMISPEHRHTVDAYLEVLGRLVDDVRSGRRARRGGRVSYSG